MDTTAAAEERIVGDRLRQKLSKVISATQSQLAPVTDHVHFTLQKAFFRCAYECFDRSRKNEEISNCVEHCSVPLLQAQNLIEGEMVKFQERLNRSLTVCQDRYETAKLHEDRRSAMKNLESCLDQYVNDSIKALPSLVGRMKNPNSD